jgi:hypothetical protein
MVQPGQAIEPGLELGGAYGLAPVGRDDALAPTAALNTASGCADPEEVNANPSLTMAGVKGALLGHARR